VSDDHPVYVANPIEYGENLAARFKLNPLVAFGVGDVPQFAVVHGPRSIDELKSGCLVLGKLHVGDSFRRV
jgi:hypothetical protein